MDVSFSDIKFSGGWDGEGPGVANVIAAQVHEGRLQEEAGADVSLLGIPADAPRLDRIDEFCVC